MAYDCYYHGYGALTDVDGNCSSCTREHEREGCPGLHALLEAGKPAPLHYCPPQVDPLLRLGRLQDARRRAAARVTES